MECAWNVPDLEVPVVKTLEFPESEVSCAVKTDSRVVCRDKQLAPVGAVGHSSHFAAFLHVSVAIAAFQLGEIIKALRVLQSVKRKGEQKQPSQVSIPL